MGGLFGLGGYEAPESPEVTSVPTEAEKQEPVSKSVRDEERRRIRSRRAMSGTLLTSPLGTTGNSILGRI